MNDHFEGFRLDLNDSFYNTSNHARTFRLKRPTPAS